MQHNTFFSLEQVIDRQPLTVTVNTPLTEVIGLMQEWGNSCSVTEETDSAADNNVGSNNSCVLVLESDRLQGIFTERDLVKLVARGTDTRSVTVGEMMTRDVVTLTMAGQEDVFTALSLLREYKIRHLPVVGDRQNLIGLITAKNLRHKLQPINLMKWRRADEIMNESVVHAHPDDSVRSIAILMADNDISCVAICQTQVDSETASSVDHPIGIITERDIVQFQNLNLDLEQPARNLMSTPLFLVSPEDSLWKIYQQMLQLRVRRLLVCGARGELAGIITQTSLLQIFDPTEMYGVIEVLQRQVCQLETEREILLQERNSKLEQEVRERTTVIAQTNQELQRRQADLNQAHQELYFHINNSPLAVVEWDSDFRIERWSKRARQMFGWQESEAIGKHWNNWQFIFEEDLGRFRQAAAQLLNGSESRNICYTRNYQKNGALIHCEWHNSVLLDESGNLISILSSIQDVSDRLLAQAQLRNRIRQQQAVTQLGQFALSAQSLNAILDRAVNLAADTLEVEYCQVLQLLPEQNILSLKAGVGWKDGLVGTATLEIEANSQAGYTLRQSQPVIVEDLDSETRFKASSLLIDHRVVSGMSVAIANSNVTFGVLEAYTTEHRAFDRDDINFLSAISNVIAQAYERRRAEAALKASERRFDSILSSLKDVVWSADARTGEILYINLAVESIHGREVAEFYHNPQLWLEVVHPEDRDRVNDFKQRLLEAGKQEIEYRIVRPNNEIRWVLDRASVIYDENCLPIRLDGIITDISEQQAALRERKRREEILRDIASGMSVEVGKNFLPSLVEYLSKTLQVDYAYVGELVQPAADTIKTQAVCNKGQVVDNFAYALSGTPCLNVVEQQLCIYPEAVRQLFPDSALLAQMQAESFAGMPIYSSTGIIKGLICIIDSKPFTDISLIEEVLKIFATRATTELERQQAEADLQKSEQKFKAIFDQSFQFIGLLKPDGKIIEANQTALDYVGLTTADVVGKPFWETPWWSMSSKARELLKQGIKTAARGEFVRFEVEHPGTENRLVTVDFSLTPVKDETGQVIMLIPEGRNISERKQAEADLQQSNQILQAISSVQTQYLAEVEPGILFDGMLEHLLQLTESEYGFIGEIIIAADGSPVMEESYMKFRGRPYLKTHAITNIAWNESTRAFYAENAPKGMEFHNLQTLFGAVIVTGEPVIANSPSDDPRRGGLPEGHPPLNAFLGVPFYKNNTMTGMVGIANRQGGYDLALIDYLQPFLATCSRIIEADRSDRQKQQAEAKVREQAALLDVATDAIMVRRLDNQLLFWNRGAEKLYGWTEEEALTTDANQLLYRQPLTKLDEIQQTAIERGEWQGELNQVTKTGETIIVESRWTLVKDAAGNPSSLLVVNTDITEQKQLEAQFLRTQRLESLGTLAGGIAHDLNNILAPILGFARLLPLKLPDVDEQTKDFFKIIETNAQRGTALVKQILTFSRGLEGDKGIVQIRHLIAEIEQIIRETFPKSIELTTNVSKNLWTVNADANQLHQVLMNLAVNARDAMSDGGKLTIKAENFIIDADYAKLHLDAAVGSYILIAIADTGVGIPTEIIDRIFEPFFTTKAIGRGTGLGLSTAIGIVKSHGGFIDVISDRSSNKGTKFEVFLPASETTALATEELTSIPQGNGETILVVDDETAILAVTKATLETYNYRVLTASNGIEAIATYARNQQAIDLVIMDIMMPSMDGKTAIRTLKQIDPEVNIIAVSGLITSKEIVNELNSDVTVFMSKPYSNDDLLETIYKIVRS